MGACCAKDDSDDQRNTVEEKKQEIDEFRVPPIDVKKTYRFGRTLGSGASCKVVEGHEITNIESRVAIKIMEKENRALKRLYDREVDVLQVLRDGKREPPKGILDFVGFQEAPDSFYIVTSLLEGGELFDRIVSKEDKYKITEKIAIGLIRSMFEALKACHDKNVIHRDLKPENFVFKDTTVDSDVVLIDYGCARVVQDTDVIDDVVGTAYYLAPELATAALYNYKKRGKQINPSVEEPKPRTGKILKASDIWSMGVIAYVMMTGKAPFRGRGNDNTGIFEASVLQPLKFPEKDARYHNKLNLNAHFKDFCTKVLVKEPLQRLTIEECLQHPWVRGVDAQDFELNSDVVTYLRQFTYQCRLKREITRVLAANMTAEPELQIKKHFNRLDVDGDGELDVDELKILLTDMGFIDSEARKEASEIMKQSDLNGDGKLQFDEFKAVWYRKVLTTNDQYVHRVFAVFDDNGDGYIDSKELAAILFPAETEAIDENKENADNAGDYGFLQTVKVMIEEVDENKDGKIEFEEFKKAMKEDMDGGRWPLEELQAGGFIGAKVEGMVSAEDMKDNQKEFKPPEE